MQVHALFSLLLLALLSVMGSTMSAYKRELENAPMKRFRGEPIRFGKRSPREPIRFGKRFDPVAYDY